ncbi:hypothetical protein RJT34_29708 [Clitoria ternatea]|uniref:RNase H type-1 domain-containing protein n=1 Tax=Clitoria ternatea TaxID=43366 RepID=A0AAN9I1D8_CLITE
MLYYNMNGPNQYGLGQQFNVFQEYLTANKEECKQVRRQQSGSDHTTWRPPPEGFYKANVDASWVNHLQQASMGLILRDQQGDLKFGEARRYWAPTVLIAEAIALREGIITAASLGIPKIIVESDNLSLIKACRKEIQVLEILPIVKDIQQLRDQFQAIGFTWTRRASNKATHMVAKLDQENNLASRW